MCWETGVRRASQIAGVFVPRLQRVTVKTDPMGGSAYGEFQQLGSHRADPAEHPSVSRRVPACRRFLTFWPGAQAFALYPVRVRPWL